MPLGLAQVYVTAHLQSPRGRSRRKLALGTDTGGPQHREPRPGGSQSCSMTHFFWSRAHSQAAECLSGYVLWVGRCSGPSTQTVIQTSRRAVETHGVFHVGPQAQRVTCPESHSEDRAKLEFRSRESKRNSHFPHVCQKRSQGLQRKQMA